MDDRQPQFKDYEPMPLTIEAATQLAFQARLRLGGVLFEAPPMDMDEVRQTLPGYALALAEYLNGQYQLPFGPVGGALVHFIIRPDLPAMDESQLEDYAQELMGWRTIVQYPELLLELLQGASDYMQTLQVAHQIAGSYVEIMQRRPTTRIGKILCQSQIRALPWYEITPDMLNNQE